MKGIDGKSVVLTSGERVMLDEKTQYSRERESGRDAAPAKRRDVTKGKAVSIWTRKQGQTLVAVWVVLARVQPPEAKEKDDALRRERKKFEGEWRVVSMEVNGRKRAGKDDEGTTVFDAEGGWKILKADGTLMSAGTSEIDLGVEPRSIRFTGKSKGETEESTARRIYEFIDANTLRTCPYPSEDERPKDFSPRGRVLFLWERIPKRAAPEGTGGFPAPGAKKMDFDFHKNVPPSGLRIELSPAATALRKAVGLATPLVLSLKMTNASSQDLAATLPHEWDGGEWPITGLYASVTPEKEKDSRAFGPAYLAGKQGGAGGVTLAAGKSTDLQLRMDWPGTGSVIGVPFIQKPGKYVVRFALVFEAAGGRQYVVTPAKVVEFAAE